MSKKEEKLQKLKDEYKRMSHYEDEAFAQNLVYIAGIDEAGRGPLAGPVVSASCILDKENPIYGLRDSKKLSAKKRDELYDLILESALDYSIGIIDNYIIDDVNILNATKLAMDKAIQGLRIRPDLILVDAVKIYDTGISTRSLIKGDDISVSIAAASIIAKVTRDRIMEEYDLAYPGYGFAQHKGYGTKAHYSSIHELGLTPIHRRSFLKNFSQ